MISERKEKTILRLSFVAGLAFALVELIFAIYSHSQSALTDAVYDASELVFIALLLFLTPLFHKPVSEKHPYGYFQSSRSSSRRCREETRSMTFRFLSFSFVWVRQAWSSTSSCAG